MINTWNVREIIMVMGLIVLILLAVLSYFYPGSKTYSCSGHQKYTSTMMSL